jgi:HSP20 family protein
MPTFQELRSGLGRALENLGAGWQRLRERTAHALTRFHAPAHGEQETAAERIARQGPRWGLLPAELIERGDELIVRLEAPGLDSRDFDLQVIENMLVIRGRKEVEREEQNGDYLLMERAYGSFERAIPLPNEVDETAARASYRRGVLQIVLPKSARAQRRRIDIEG